MQISQFISIACMASLLALAGCDALRKPAQPDAEKAADTAGPAEKAANETTAVAGKPTAPIDITYNVIGAAFVGQPVNIEIDVSSPLRDQQISLEYRINDPRDLSFGESQPQRISMSAIGDAPSARREVTVVPQREGRLYLNVSAAIETAGGTLIKAIAIPVQVGKARRESSVNGELKKDADGEAVESMPADEQ